LARVFFRAIVAKMGIIDMIENALDSWAQGYFAAGARIQNLNRLSGGASQETWAFEVNNHDQLHQLILRRAPGGTAMARSSEAVSLATEAALLEAAAVSGVPVPRVLHVSESGTGIGEGFIMSRIGGETIGRKILRDNRYAKARDELAAQCGTALARIHKIVPDPLSELPVSLGMDQLLKYENIYRDFGMPRPVFEFAIAWLKQNVPQPLSPVLVHGDFRLGNLIVDEGGLAAVLDWELAHLGDPREDIAWICVNSWRFGYSEKRVGGFGDLKDLLKAYTAAGGPQLEAGDIDWWEMLGSLKWGVMCMIMYSVYKTGADASIERAAIGRRVSETEIDLINLFERVQQHA
jgi:aminoglycoside phosphotransferase (APT) family kinase protein